jgi:hypothetical protein
VAVALTLVRTKQIRLLFPNNSDGQYRLYVIFVPFSGTWDWFFLATFCLQLVSFLIRRVTSLVILYCLVLQQRPMNTCFCSWRASCHDALSKRDADTVFPHYSSSPPPPLTATDLGQMPSDVDRSGVCRIIEGAVRRDSVEPLFHYVCDLGGVVPPALMILLTDNNRKYPNHLYLLEDNCSWLTFSLYSVFYTRN